nr:DUF2397 family protein [Nocardia zapadnayensis]
MDHEVFERLLDLLGRALGASPASDGARRGRTSDGRVEIVLHPPPDAATATVTTPHGVFRGPDYLVAVSAPGTPARRSEAAG